MTIGQSILIILEIIADTLEIAWRDVMYTTIKINSDDHDDVEELLYQADIDFEWSDHSSFDVSDDDVERVLALLDNHGIGAEEK